MELSQEQIEKFKIQIIKQIESSFPEEKKNSAIEKVNSMNKEEFIEFLKKNKLLGSDKDIESLDYADKEETPFRMIVDEKILSYKIDENKEAIAVLEINPVSKGHTIIIPKKPVYDSKKIPKEVLSLANSVSKRIKTKLNPKEVSVSTSNVLGETIMNVLPIYSGESLSSPRKQAPKEELEQLMPILEKKSAAKREKKAKTTKIEDTKMIIPRRIP